jgi:galactoside 2-L-fucosyltransferase 1/2
MELLRKKLAVPLAFVIASDDPEWCRKYLQKSQDIFVMGIENRAESDLALLASCNHTIFDYGTFGLTASMFNTEGQTVVFDTGSTDYFLTYQFALQLKSWTKLGNSA